MKFFYSASQPHDVNYVVVNGETILYTECGCEKSNYEDAILLADFPIGTPYQTIHKGVTNNWIADK